MREVLLQRSNKNKLSVNLYFWNGLSVEIPDALHPVLCIDALHPEFLALS